MASSPRRLTPGWSCLKYSRTTCRRASGCGRTRARLWEHTPSKIETVRPGGAWQRFTMVDRDGHMESVEEIPEPHAFTAYLQMGGESYAVEFVEHEQAHSPTARETCGPRSFTSSPTQRFRFSSLWDCLWRSHSVGSGARWRSGWKTALIPRPTAWYAGAVPTCVTASPPNSIFICMSAASASF